METRSVIGLPLTSCVLLQLPDTKVDCSISNESTCIGCNVLGRFITGENIDDVGSLGHVICAILWLVTFLVGICGTFGNMIIIYVLHCQSRATAFDTFLFALAWIDLVCAVTSLITSTAAVIYFENFSGGEITHYIFLLASHTALFANSASSFMTVVITVERYLAVAFPLKTIGRTSKTRVRILIAGVIFFSCIMAIPRYFSMKVSENIDGRDIISIKHLDYLIMTTKWNTFWYGTMKGVFNQLDFWLPLPLLLLFNGLIYFEVLKIVSRRQDLNIGQRKEIRAVKMFRPVVIVLFLCNIVPIIHYAFIENGVVYRELHLGIFCAFAFNSAANLPIYYAKGSGFRKEMRAMITHLFPGLQYWLSIVSDKSQSSTLNSCNQQAHQ